jgi:hypothetical protein
MTRGTIRENLDTNDIGPVPKRFSNTTTKKFSDGMSDRNLCAIFSAQLVVFYHFDLSSVVKESTAALNSISFLAKPFPHNKHDCQR